MSYQNTTISHQPVDKPRWIYDMTGRCVGEVITDENGKDVVKLFNKEPPSLWDLLDKIEKLEEEMKILKDGAVGGEVSSPETPITKATIPPGDWNER